VVYGCKNKVFGGLGSKYEVHLEKPLNHHFEVYSGFFQNECEALNE